MSEDLREALGLSEDRLGKNRGSSLDESELSLYRWVLRTFASGIPPSPADVRHAATSRNVVVETALSRMVEEDLIELSASGVITCAYPFSATPTTHVVVVEGANAVYAMCAIDALGIPIMLQRNCRIETSDPGSGAPILMHVTAGGDAQTEPQSAVVLSAVASGSGPLSSLCCPLVNTFASTGTAERFLKSHAELSGQILSISEALAYGAAVFGGALG